MIRLALVYPALCFVLLGAHLLFHGYGMAVAMLPLISAVLLFVRNPWCARLCGLLLICSGAEWAYTALELAIERQAHGLPWIRATAIIGGCAAATWMASLMLFWNKFDAFYKRKDA